MNYLIDYTDNVLDAHPQTVIVLGGDFNQLDYNNCLAGMRWLISRRLAIHTCITV